MVENSCSKTFQYQDKLPMLPIPSLEYTSKRYLAAVNLLQVNIIVEIYFYFERN